MVARHDNIVEADTVFFKIWAVFAHNGTESFPEGWILIRNYLQKPIAPEKTVAFFRNGVYLAVFQRDIQRIVGKPLKRTRIYPGWFGRLRLLRKVIRTPAAAGRDNDPVARDDILSKL